MTVFVEVAVALPIHGTFHYAVPQRLVQAPQVGARVLVPFGRRGVTGVVVAHSDAPPEGIEVKEVREVLDASPALDPDLIELCRWVSAYYEAPLGEVLRTALPAGTTVTTRAVLRLTEAGTRALTGEFEGAVPDGARRLLARVGKGDFRGNPSALIEAGWAERVDNKRAARVKIKRVALIESMRAPTEEERGKLLARAPRRQEALSLIEASVDGIELPHLAKQVKGARSAITALLQAGIVARREKEVVRDPWQTPSRMHTPSADEITLSDEQEVALSALTSAFDEKTFATFLLHGITGSGKTEVYMRVIARMLDETGGAIVLVPEIALTPQLAARFRARFGDAVAVLHSGLSSGERFDQWRRLKSGDARIALGARSAIFAPISDLRVVIVDEEHDSSFKQEEGVRYHARNVAIVRAKNAGAICVLGSATPSMESYANAKNGRYGLLELAERPTANRLPKVEIIDLRSYQADGDTMLAAPLTRAIEDTLLAGEQVILFLNRRGFATFVVCVACGHSFRCPDCSVSLTYHRAGEKLRCHYCGYSEAVPNKCTVCNTETLRRLGLGTERIEHALKERFPQARVGRLDRDTASGSGVQRVLDRVAAREIDILIGTQMVTKGHDFPDVTLVGVLLADTALSLPDFRASERTFQLLMQVAGRAGRGERPGNVLIQTYCPDAPAVACARTHDFHGFFASELAARSELGYPPTGRIMAIRFDGPDEQAVRAVGAQLEEGLRMLRDKGSLTGGVVVLGPAEAPLRRLKSRYRWQLWLKGPEQGALRKAVRWLVRRVARTRGAVRVTVDVDPMSTL